MTASLLREKNVYQLTNKVTGKTRVGVFCHWGQTGYAIFQPLGEPSFQDLFLLDELEKWEFEFLRWATSDDLGY